MIGAGLQTPDIYDVFYSKGNIRATASAVTYTAPTSNTSPS